MAENLLTMIGPAASAGVGFSTVFFLLIMFIVLTITAIHVYFKSKESYKLGIEIPGPDPIPILGNALLALGKTPNGKQKHLYNYRNSVPQCARAVFCYLKIELIIFFIVDFDRNHGRVFAAR